MPRANNEGTNKVEGKEPESSKIEPLDLTKLKSKKQSEPPNSINTNEKGEEKSSSLVTRLMDGASETMKKWLWKESGSNDHTGETKQSFTSSAETKDLGVVGDEASKSASKIEPEGKKANQGIRLRRRLRVAGLERKQGIGKKERTVKSSAETTPTHELGNNGASRSAPDSSTRTSDVSKAEEIKRIYEEIHAKSDGIEKKLDICEKVFDKLYRNISEKGKEIWGEEYQRFQKRLQGEEVGGNKYTIEGAIDKFGIMLLNETIKDIDMMADINDKDKQKLINSLNKDLEEMQNLIIKKNVISPENNRLSEDQVQSEKRQDQVQSEKRQDQKADLSPAQQRLEQLVSAKVGEELIGDGEKDLVGLGFDKYLGFDTTTINLKEIQADKLRVYTKDGTYYITTKEKEKDYTTEKGFNPEEIKYTLVRQMELNLDNIKWDLPKIHAVRTVEEFKVDEYRTEGKYKENVVRKRENPEKMPEVLITDDENVVRKTILDSKDMDTVNPTKSDAEQTSWKAVLPWAQTGIEISGNKEKSDRLRQEELLYKAFYGEEIEKERLENLSDDDKNKIKELSDDGEKYRKELGEIWKKIFEVYYNSNPGDREKNVEKFEGYLSSIRDHIIDGEKINIVDLKDKEGLKTLNSNFGEIKKNHRELRQFVRDKINEQFSDLGFADLSSYKTYIKGDLYLHEDGGKIHVADRKQGEGWISERLQKINNNEVKWDLRVYVIQRDQASSENYPNNKGPEIMVTDDWSLVTRRIKDGWKMALPGTQTGIELSSNPDERQTKFYQNLVKLRRNKEVNSKLQEFENNFAKYYLKAFGEMKQKLDGIYQKYQEALKEKLASSDDVNAIGQDLIEQAKASNKELYHTIKNERIKSLILAGIGEYLSSDLKKSLGWHKKNIEVKMENFKIFDENGKISIVHNKDLEQCEIDDALIEKLKKDSIKEIQWKLPEMSVIKECKGNTDEPWRISVVPAGEKVSYREEEGIRQEIIMTINAISTSREGGEGSSRDKEIGTGAGVEDNKENGVEVPGISNNVEAASVEKQQASGKQPKEAEQANENGGISSSLKGEEVLDNKQRIEQITFDVLNEHARNLTEDQRRQVCKEIVEDLYESEPGAKELNGEGLKEEIESKMRTMEIWEDVNDGVANGETLARKTGQEHSEKKGGEEKRADSSKDVEGEMGTPVTGKASRAEKVSDGEGVSTGSGEKNGSDASKLGSEKQESGRSHEQLDGNGGETHNNVVPEKYPNDTIYAAMEQEGYDIGSDSAKRLAKQIAERLVEAKLEINPDNVHQYLETAKCEQLASEGKFSGSDEVGEMCGQLCEAFGDYAETKVHDEEKVSKKEFTERKDIIKVSGDNNECFIRALLKSNDLMLEHPQLSDARMEEIVKETREFLIAAGVAERGEQLSGLNMKQRLDVQAAYTIAFLRSERHIDVNRGLTIYAFRTGNNLARFDLIKVGNDQPAIEVYLKDRHFWAVCEKEKAGPSGEVGQIPME